MNKSRKFIDLTVFFAFSLMLLTASFSTIRGAGEVDPAFNPAAINVRGAATNANAVKRLAVQPDGKVLVAGYFQAVGKAYRSGIARLNADGTVDASFNPPTFFSNYTGYNTFGGFIFAVAVQTDGKIIVGGDFSAVDGQSRPGLARLNADGSVDTSFSLLNGSGTNFVGRILDLKISDDGRITFAGGFTYTAAGTQRNIARVLADGRRDASFVAPSITANYFYRLELLAGGKILVSNNGTDAVNRLNGDGSPDAAFSPISLGGSSNPVIRVLADGKFLVGGNFTSVNGFSLRRLARFNADGSIDTSFVLNGGPDSEVTDIEITPNGMILVGGGFANYSGASRPKIALLDPNGSLSDAIIPAETNALINDLAILPDGKILIGATVIQSALSPGLVRLNGDGSLDGSFSLIIGNPARVNKVFVQSDGKILVGGDYTHIDGRLRYHLSRVNPNGTLDTSFTPAVYDYPVLSIDVRADGMILAGTTQGVRRLNPDGSTNLVFGNSGTDAKFLPGGGMIVSTYGNALTKYLESGVRSFNLFANELIRNINIQPDGKFIVTGDFTQIVGGERGRIARLNTDGTVDATFNPAGGANNSIFASVLQTDGKIIIGGNFSGINFNSDYKNLARLNADGTLDTSFNPTVAGGVQSLKIQPDGKILVGGSMYSVNGLASRIVRLNQNGSLDTSFNSAPGPDNAVLTIDTEATGNIIIGGLFIRVSGVDRFGVARLNAAAAIRAKFDFDGDGKADLSVFRPAAGAWYLNQSSAGFVGIGFGLSNDKIVPADYDGDGKTDVAVFRGGVWYLLRSQLGFTNVRFGAADDIPAPADFDGDGKADLAVFRPSNGVWYLQQSTAGFAGVQFGQNGDQPVAADYDGDGKSDLAVYRGGTWYLNRSQAGFVGIGFGTAEDKATPADYDGDGKTDVAVFRPSNGTWYLQRSTAGFAGISFGATGDLPAAADYDGDGKADVAVFRGGTWYLNRTTAGFSGVAFGASTDTPVPNAFVR